MRSLVTILVVALMILSAQFYLSKGSAPGPGQTAPQTISTIGVEMDLNSLAQAQRMYFAQNGTYANLDQLASSKMLDRGLPGRDGYTYSVELSPAGFKVTASHPEVPAGVIPGSKALHYPALSIDQNLQIHHSN